MNRLLALLILPAVLSLGSVEPAAAEDNHPPGDDSGPGGRSKKRPKRDQPKEKTAAQCISHTTQARFVSGYDHLVHVTNSCDRAVSCDVSTDVNPQVQKINLPARGKKTVLTFRGSPARVFKATVDCKMTK